MEVEKRLPRVHKHGSTLILTQWINLCGHPRKDEVALRIIRLLTRGNGTAFYRLRLGSGLRIKYSAEELPAYAPFSGLLFCLCYSFRRSL